MSIIEVTHVTKEFKLGQLTSLKQTALNTLNRLTGRPVEERKPFKGLDDVTFSVEQGEVGGIIGANGVGKCTILKLLANTRNRRKVLSRLRWRRTSQWDAGWPAPNTVSRLILRNASMTYRGRITIEPCKRGNKPRIRGMRMTVYDVSLAR